MNVDKLQAEVERRANAMEHLIPFVEYMMPTYSAQSFHHKIADKLEAIERGEVRRLMIFVPPQHGKSCLTSMHFPAWFLGKNPNLHIISASYGADLAYKFGRANRNILRERNYRAVFPGVTLADDATAQDEWHTNSGGGYKAEGVGGGLTGFPAHVALIDDPFKDYEDAASAGRRQLVWDWYNTVLFTRLNPYKGGKGAVCIIQTRWSWDDLSGRLLEEMETGTGEQWEVISLPSLAEEGDPLGREIGDALWPDKYPKDYLEAYRDRNPRHFSALHQQRPAPDSGDLFKREDFNYYIDLPKQLRYYGASDYGTSKNSGDYTVHGVVGVDKDMGMYIVDWWRAKADTFDSVERQIDMMDQWKTLLWADEKGNIHNAVEPFLLRRMKERGVYRRREAFGYSRGQGDKESKASSFAAMMQMRRVFFPKNAAWTEHLEYELLKFPGGKNDDQVDVCGLFGRMVEAMRPALVQTVTRPLEIEPVMWTFDQMVKRGKHRRKGRAVSREFPVLPPTPKLIELDPLVLN